VRSASGPEYEPVNLASVAGSRLDVFPIPTTLVGGPRALLGLPFDIAIGDGGAPRVVAFGGPHASSARIPIDRQAVHVIVAHIVLDQALEAGGPVGDLVATYRFVFVDDDRIEVPIRERFEIGTVQVQQEMPHHPFAAVPDAKPTLMPRVPRDWDLVGRYATEVDLRGWPSPFTLWAWRNPRPDVAIACLEIAGTQRQAVIGAITLGHADEWPFVRSAPRTVGIELLRAGDAGQSFDLTVDVDRGTAGAAYPLPSEGRTTIGWGAPRNTRRSPAYVPVAAIPSATVAVRAGDEMLGAARWSDIESGPVDIDGRVRLRVLDEGRNWVRTTVRGEDATPIPCRIAFRSPSGVPYQPHGHHDQLYGGHTTWNVDVGGDLRLGQRAYAYIDGSCEGWLPRGEVIVEVARGFEYEPLEAHVRIEPGQRALELRLKRRWDMSADGWYSGDTHVHFLSAQGALLEARGEDLNVVNLLQAQWGRLFTNTEEFTGEPLVSRDARTAVHVSQENRQHLLGHLILLGLRKPVMPWSSDGAIEAELGGALETTLSHWADACHGQGGSVIIPHFPRPNGEHAALIASGRADAVEMIRHGAFNHLEYYRYLNSGYRLPLVGGTDKMSSEVPVGLYRTYVRIPKDEGFSHESWMRNLKLGRTFMSGGPLVRLTVDGHEIGDVVRLPRGGDTLEIAAEVDSIFPVQRLEIVSGGRVIAATEEGTGTSRLRLRERIRVDGSTWIAARTGAADYMAPIPHFDVWARGIFAHTSPVYIEVGDEALFDRSGVEYLLTLVQGARVYLRNTAAHDPPERVTHHHGEQDHIGFLDRPFAEAEAALRRRLES
jgi:hypothetical protein